MNGKKTEKKNFLALLLAILLFATFLVLFDNLWRDIGELVSKGIAVAPNITVQQRAALELKKLVVHFIYVTLLLSATSAVFFALRSKADNLKAVTVPVLLASAVTFIRLLFEAGSYMIRQYEKTGLYLVIIGALIVLIAAIMLIQSRWSTSEQ